jgi:hypothetical protein
MVGNISNQVFKFSRIFVSIYRPGVPKLFWFKPPLTLKIVHARTPSTVLANQVTTCKKLRIMKIEESLKLYIFEKYTVSSE